MSSDSEDSDIEQVLPFIQDDINKQEELIAMYKKNIAKKTKIIENTRTKLKDMKTKKIASERETNQQLATLDFYKSQVKNQRKMSEEIQNLCATLLSKMNIEENQYVEKIHYYQAAMSELRDKFLGLPQTYAPEHLRNKISATISKINIMENGLKQMKAQSIGLQQTFFSPANENDTKNVNILIDEFEKFQKLVKKTIIAKNNLDQIKAKLTQDLLQAMVSKTALEEELKQLPE